jgi:methanogenic corrinoid protein MtbC1
MVAERFEMNGFDVWDLGADMPSSDFAWLLQDRQVDLIALGATLVLHIGSARQTIASLRVELGSACPPILVGGMPFTVVADLHEVIGADAVATDPAMAVARGEALLRPR